MFILIFVTVGSRGYPFDRLFKKLDELYEDGTLTEEMFAQIGTSTYKPKNYQYKDFSNYLYAIEIADSLSNSFKNQNLLEMTFKLDVIYSYYNSLSRVPT